MTREEAIKWLKKARNNTGINELSRAFDVAIKALEQEPCKEEKSCKNCKHSDKGMVNAESGRCEACYYDWRLGGNCLFEKKPKQRDKE